MKKIIIYCLVIICLSWEKSYSQKIDLDKETWAHSYIRIPRNHGLVNLKTYSVNMFANPDNLIRIGLTPEKIESNIRLDGFVYTTDLADIIIDVMIENIKSTSDEVNTKEVTVYEGGKNVTKKLYQPVTKYVMPTTIRITKALSNEAILNRVIGDNQNPIVLGSGEFATYEAAQTTFKGSSEKRFESFKETFYNLLYTTLNDFKEKYDFTITKEMDVFWNVDLKKYPEYAEFNDNLKAAKEIFANQNVTDDIKVTREKLVPVMQYLRENADKLTGDDKKNKKLKYAYLLNLGKIQLWLEMVDESSVTAQQVIDNDYDKLDGKVLLKAASLLRDELKKSPNGTRYFKRDGFASTTHFTASEVQPVPFKFPNPPAGFKSYKGSMTSITGEQFKGELWASSAGSLSFEPRAATRFVYEKNNELKEQPIDLNEISEITLESGVKFARLKYEGYDMFFQVLYENGNFRILRYFRSNEEGVASIKVADLNNGHEMCLMKKVSGEIRSVSALLAGIAAKRTAEFYSGCEPLKSKILAEEFGKMNELDSQIKALTFFEQNCK